MKVKLGLSLEGKSTPFVIKSSKKEPKKFFRAQVYDFVKLVNRIRSESDLALQKDDLRELLETLPLLLMNIARTREKWLIGKIKNQPFDIFIAPERFVEIKNKNVNIYRGLFIQTKRIYKYPPQQMTFNEWIILLQSIIEEKIINIKPGFNGSFHFYNCIQMSENVKIDRFRALLKKLHIPYNKYVDSITLSIEMADIKNEKTVVTLFIYPFVSKIIGAFDPDFQRAKQIYVTHDMTQMTLEALMAKHKTLSN